MKQLDVSPEQGLTADAAARRQQVHGPKTLTKTPAKALSNIELLLFG
ncbi:MAG: hypothetical protein HKP58_04735 [Desulfatitalea sp.]|nr:hypothetical protein [Desulfatitalea sp.]NNJ99698.1 hypothetical protein [Desulfatitalea sp.]